MCSTNFTIQGQPFSDPLLLPIAAGIILRNVREFKHLTQSDLASRAQMNVSYISNVENGQNNISVVKFYLLCFGLGVQPEAVLGLALKLMTPLYNAIRHRSPREAERLIHDRMPRLLDVNEIVATGFKRPYPIR